MNSTVLCSIHGRGSSRLHRRWSEEECPPTSKWKSPPTETPHLCLFLNYCETTTTILLGAYDSALITHCLGMLLSLKMLHFLILESHSQWSRDSNPFSAYSLPLLSRISLPPILTNFCMLHGPTPLPRSGDGTLAEPCHKWGQPFSIFGESVQEQ